MWSSKSKVQWPGCPVAARIDPKAMSPLGTSATSSSDSQNIRSLLISLALRSTQAMLSQLSTNRRPLGLPAAYFAAWNSNLEGGLARALSGVKCVMSMLGIGWVVIASPPLATL